MRFVVDAQTGRYCRHLGKSLLWNWGSSSVLNPKGTIYSKNRLATMAAKWSRMILRGLIHCSLFAWSVLPFDAHAGHETYQYNNALVAAHTVEMSINDLRRHLYLQESHVKTKSLNVRNEGKSSPENHRFRNEEGSHAHLVETRRPSTPAAHIGAIMAILSTFNEANVLPPEHDPQANQLIHALIQLQSVLLKSQNAAIHEFVRGALALKYEKSFESIHSNISNTGLSMQVLESLIDYAETHSPWLHEELTEEFLTYNVQRVDWNLVRKLVLEARGRLALANKTLVQVYARQRLEMPGALP